MSTLKAVRLKDEGFRPGALNNKGEGFQEVEEEHSVLFSDD